MLPNNKKEVLANFQTLSSQLDNDVLLVAWDIAAKVYNNSDSKRNRYVVGDMSIHNTATGRELAKVKSDAGKTSRYKTLVKLVVYENGKPKENDEQLRILTEAAIGSYPDKDTRNRVKYKHGFIYTSLDKDLKIDELADKLSLEASKLNSNTNTPTEDKNAVEEETKPKATKKTKAKKEATEEQTEVPNIEQLEIQEGQYVSK
jgi:hypothetical protein